VRCERVGALWDRFNEERCGRESLRRERRSVVEVEERCGRGCVTLWKRRSVVGKEARCRAEALWERLEWQSCGRGGAW
jgi:hypothetical protein